MNKVSQEAFLKYLTEHFLDYMSASFLEKKPAIEVKDGAVFVNMFEVSPESTPKILIDSLYEHYIYSDEELDMFICDVARGYEERFNKTAISDQGGAQVDLPEDHTVMDIPDWRERIILAVTNAARNDQVLSLIPHIRKGDYIVFCQCGLGTKNMSGCYNSYITVTNEVFGPWHIKIDQMIDLAATNSQIMFPGELQSLNAYDSVHQFDFLSNRLFVLSNKYHFNGAAALFYQPELLKNMSAVIGEKNFVLFPSGYNEIFCLAIERGKNWKGYQELFDLFQNESGYRRGLGSKILFMDCEKKVIRQLDGGVYSPALISAKRTVSERKI